MIDLETKAQVLNQQALLPALPVEVVAARARLIRLRRRLATALVLVPVVGVSIGAIVLVTQHKRSEPSVSVQPRTTRLPVGPTSPPATRDANAALTRPEILDIVKRDPGVQSTSELTAKYALASDLRPIDAGRLNSRLAPGDTPVWVVEVTGGYKAPGNLKWVVEVFDARSGDLLVQVGSNNTDPPDWWKEIVDKGKP